MSCLAHAWALAGSPTDTAHPSAVFVICRGDIRDDGTKVTDEEAALEAVQYDRPKQAAPAGASISDVDEGMAGVWS